MSLLVPVALGATALYIFSSVETERGDRKREQQQFLELAHTQEPHQGKYLDPKKQWGAQTRHRFVSMQEMTDVNGARVFLVDYGTGGKVYQYADPRIIW